MSEPGGERARDARPTALNDDQGGLPPVRAGKDRQDSAEDEGE